MSLRLAGYVIIGSATPGEDPVTVGYVWMDSGTNKLKICTSVSPYTWVEVTGAGGASAWGAITGTLSDQTDLQTALNAKQPLDSDLTTIAGLTPTTDNFMVAVASAWASRTPAQAKTTLALDNVTNTSDVNKPVSTAQQTALDGKAALVHATRHQSGGADPIALDTLAAPTDVATLNASITAHGLLKKLSGVDADFMNGLGLFTPVRDDLLSFSDTTSNDATTGRHGLLPKLSGSESEFMRGDGAWGAPAGTGNFIGSVQSISLVSGAGTVGPDISVVINRKLVVSGLGAIVSVSSGGRLRIL